MRRWRLGNRPPSQRTPAAPSRSDPAPLTARKIASACTSAAGARIQAWAKASAPKMPTISTTALITSGRAVTPEPRSFEFVAHAPHRLDVLGQIRVLLHFLAQAADVDGDRSLVAEEGRVPDLVE